MHDLIDQAVVDNRAIRKVRTTKRATTMQAKVNLPSPTAFYDATPNNGWTGSWTKGIEKGFDNVIHYRFAAKGGIPGSRSGKGIQLKNVYNAMMNFNTKSYIMGKDGFREMMKDRLRGQKAMPKGGISNLKAFLKAKATAVFARFIGR
jgi:hypothetical protein